MLISVLIPTYNAARHLDACLEALSSQEHPRAEYEVIVIDNGSTDGSAALARRHAGVIVVEEPKPGAYAARNRGLRQARGEVIAFTDPDCVVHRSWLRAIAASMSDPRLDLVCGARRPGGRSRLLEAVFDYENAKAEFVLGGDDEELYFGYCNNMAARRSLFDRLGDFLELPRGADTVFVRKVARERSPAAIRYLPEAVVSHLEVDRLWAYYGKVFLYGRYRRRNNAILSTRPLRLGERLRVYRRAVEGSSDPRLRKAALLAALAIGSVAWWLGSASAVLGTISGSVPSPWRRVASE